MRVLCLHGRGSNNEIFQMQTASIRAGLDDFEWEFVQGTILHTEGNWSLYTTSFSKLPLYAYYNPLDPHSIIQTETELLQIIEEEGPFDGVLAYSGGASLAAQLIIKDAQDHPFKLPHERPFRFAIFINGASPLHVFNYADAELGADAEQDLDASTLIEEAAHMFLRPSAVRKKGQFDEEDQPDVNHMLELLATLKGKRLADGTPFLTDGKHGLTRYNALYSRILIDIPTLHVRSPIEEDRHHGLHLVEMCDPNTRMEFHHKYGHDFPRGRLEIKKIVELIRQTAECQ
ncbi:serine hydrolase FSH [Leptodontidium sp. 2 PMI_412]|nr:serine hydrolase FSH [Leptodontidium sp. MPI-SDFR-AT-0119]KAH9221750.1 serine hydrolase FSH [Leptodontidium sp. 2 PMI_412]